MHSTLFETLSITPARFISVADGSAATAAAASARSYKARCAVACSAALDVGAAEAALNVTAEATYAAADSGVAAAANPAGANLAARSPSLGMTDA